MLKLAQMGPKPIQDVTPPSPATSSPAELPLGPEIVGDIPVRVPAGHTGNEQKPTPLKDDVSSFIIPANPTPAAINKDKEKPKTEASKPKPTLAIAVALLAMISLAAGAYLKIFSNR